MSRNSVSHKAREYLKRLGNPYAFTQIEGFSEDEESAVSDATAKAHQTDTKPDQADLFSKASSQLARWNHPHGNPYSRVGNDESELRPISQETASRASIQTTSQTEFVRSLRRIFSHYIPALERGRLRPEHRDFIERNRRRSGRIRYLLLQELRKYDLSDLVGLKPQFNREGDALTEMKLRQIEQSVLGEE